MTRKTASDISGVHSSNGMAGPQPLTSVQMGVWMDQMRYPDSPFYNVGMTVNVDGVVDQDLFVRALEEVSRRHSALRLVFGTQSDVPWQRILESIDVPFQNLDLRLSRSPDADARQLVQKAMNRTFPLDGSLMWACMLIRTGEQRYVWSARFHHLICDGVSVSNFFMELSRTYTRLWQGEADEGEVPPSFDVYWGAERDYLTSTRADRDRQFWAERFATLPPALLSLHQGLDTPSGGSGSELHTWTLSRERYEAIGAYAKGHGASVNSFFLALLACYFYRIARISDIVIGAPVHNRSGRLHRQAMGMFSSVVPVRFEVDGLSNFSDLMQHVGAELRRSYRHQHLSVSEINRCASLDYLERSSLYDVVLAFDQFSAEALLGDVHTRLTRVRHQDEHTPLAISVNDYYENEDVIVEFSSNPAYIEGKDVQCMLDRLGLMLDSILDRGEIQVGSICIMDEDERYQVIHDFNATQTEYPKEVLIHELFEQQVGSDA